MKFTMRTLLITLVLLAAVPGAMAQNLTLMLDWFPNVDHLPIYVAQEKGYFTEENVQVKILSPSDTADALKLAVAGKVDLAVSYEPQTIIAASDVCAVFFRGIQCRKRFSAQFATPAAVASAAPFWLYPRAFRSG